MTSLEYIEFDNARDERIGPGVPDRVVSKSPGLREAPGYFDIISFEVESDGRRWERPEMSPYATSRNALSLNVKGLKLNEESRRKYEVDAGYVYERNGQGDWVLKGKEESSVAMSPEEAKNLDGPNALSELLEDQFLVPEIFRAGTHVAGVFDNVLNERARLSGAV